MNDDPSLVYPGQPLPLKKEVACLVCGGQMRPSPIPGLLRCEACSFQNANLTINIDELASLYTEKYFNGHEYANYLADSSAIEKSFRRRLQTLLRFTPEPNERVLFEVGCAYGLFLNIAKPYYKHVAGIDISAAAVEHARSTLLLDATCGDLLSSALPERLDVACLWDTIEHLSHPHLYIEKLATVMPNGGVIAITTGDIDSTVARWRGQHWRQIHPPTHLQYFSKRTLASLLQRYGFTVRYIGFDGMYRNAESMSYIIFALKRRQPRIHEMLKRLGVLNFTLYLNLRDIIFMIAEKTV